MVFRRVDIFVFYVKIVLKRTKRGADMIPLNPWEHHNAIKVLYAKCMEGVCEKYHITRMELDILLFLSNNPIFDTASDIVDIRYLSKSQVSAAIKRLEKDSYLEKKYIKGNRKTAHLVIKESASDIIEIGRAHV